MSDKALKNGNFVQFYRDTMPAVRKLIKENALAAEILIFISEQMDGYNAVIASYQVLTDITGKSRISCSNAVKYLRENGYVTVLKSGTSNVYVVNPEIAWTSYGNQKSLCKFNGKIVLSATENKAFYYKNHSDKFKKLPDPQEESA